MRYLDEPIEEAARNVVSDLLKDGGLGGIVAVDKQGNGITISHLCMYALETDVGLKLSSRNAAQLRRHVPRCHPFGRRASDSDLFRRRIVPALRAKIYDLLCLSHVD
jgi:hypothetical protein